MTAPRNAPPQDGVAAAAATLSTRIVQDASSLTNQAWYCRCPASRLDG